MEDKQEAIDHADHYSYSYSSLGKLAMELDLYMLLDDLLQVRVRLELQTLVLEPVRMLVNQLLKPYQ